MRCLKAFEKTIINALKCALQSAKNAQNARKYRRRARHQLE
jgi:hypothetical protein